MNEREWLEQLAILQLRWPQSKITDESADLWFLDLSEFEGEQVEAAITALYRDGREWAPNGAQIRNKLLELRAGDQSWARAYELAMDAARSHGGYEYGGLSWLRGQDELAARTVETYDWESFCRSEATADGTRRAQFRDIYNELAGSAARHERYRGIPSGGLKALEGEGPRRIGEMIELEPGEDAA